MIGHVATVKARARLATKKSLEIMKMTKTNESKEQISLFHWAKLHEKKYPELEWLYHIPNGGKRHLTTAIRLKKEGVKAGVPDICLPVACGNYHGLYIELKAGKNKTTENQDKWLEALVQNGYHAVTCYGWDEAKNAILEYLKLSKILRGGAAGE